MLHMQQENVGFGGDGDVERNLAQSRAANVREEGRCLPDLLAVTFRRGRPEPRQPEELDVKGLERQVLPEVYRVQDADWNKEVEDMIGFRASDTHIFRLRLLV